MPKQQQMPNRVKPAKPPKQPVRIGTSGRPRSDQSGFTSLGEGTSRDGGDEDNSLVQEQMAQQGPYIDPYMMDPWMMGDFWWEAEMAAEQSVLAAETEANGPMADEKWGEVDQVTGDDLLDENGQMREFPDDAVLFIANGPEDMKRLQLEQEAGILGDKLDNLVILWNPSPQAVQMAAGTNKFSNVIVSGHGEEGVMYMTDQDGEGMPVSGRDFADLFAGTAVENVFLNACHGAGGADSVASSLNEVGLNVIGWARRVQDTAALDAAEMLAELADTIAAGDLTADVIQETADRFDGAGGNLVASMSQRLNTAQGEGGESQEESDPALDEFDAMLDFGMFDWFFF